MQPSELDQLYRAIVSWAAPLVVIATLHYLQKISSRLFEISISLNSIVNTLKAHDEKFQQHEKKFDDYDERLSYIERQCPLFQKRPN